MSPRPTLETLLPWLPLGAHVRRGEPRLARLAPYLFSSLLSFSLPSFHCVTPRHFTRSEAGEVNAREVAASSCTRVAQSKGSRMRQSSAVGTLTRTDPNLFPSSGVVSANRNPAGCRKNEFSPGRPGITIGLRTFCFRFFPPVVPVKCSTSHPYCLILCFSHHGASASCNWPSEGGGGSISMVISNGNGNGIPVQVFSKGYQTRNYINSTLNYDGFSLFSH